MLPNYQEELRALRDIKGVIGAFVFDGAGILCMNDMPAVLAPRVLAENGPRLLRIINALATSQSTDAFAIRFVEHRLAIRPLTDLDGYLGVLSDAQTNLAALRMAMTLAVRKLQGLVLTPLLTTSPSPEGASDRSASNSKSHSPELKTRVLYRGRIVAE